MKLINKNIILKTARSREEWYQNRFFAVGASDVSTLFGLNSFSNIVELFWNRVRLTPPTPHNENSYSGELHEDLVMKKYFVFYDPRNPTPERMLQNAEADRKLRRVQRFKRGIFMKDTPLSCTLDYLCLPDEILPSGAVVEVKNMLGYVVGKYESGVIPGHILQVQAQLLCTGFQWAYLVYYVDGRFFRCFPIEANLDIQVQIRERTLEFWNTRVLPARALWNDPSMSEQQKMLTIYEAYEPPIDPTAQDSLQEFMNTRFRDISKLGKMIINDNLEGYISGYKVNRALESESENNKSKFGNEIRSAMIAHAVDEITNPDGKVLVSYRQNAAGKLTLRVN